MRGFEGLAWHDLTGLLGVILVLLAYFGLQAGRMRGDGFVYQLMNLIGALLILLSLANNFNLSAAVVELSWVIITVYGMIRAHRIRRERSGNTD